MALTESEVAAVVASLRPVLTGMAVRISSKLPGSGSVDDLVQQTIADILTFLREQFDPAKTETPDAFLRFICYNRMHDHAMYAAGYRRVRPSGKRDYRPPLIQYCHELVKDVNNVEIVPGYDNAEETRQSMLPDGADVFRDRLLSRALESLKDAFPTYYYVVVHVCVYGRPMNEVGDELGIGASRVSQLKHGGLGYLRRWLKSRGIESSETG